LFTGGVTAYDHFGHALEAVDGDGLWGCSKYGYPYNDAGDGHLPGIGAGSPSTFPAGILPVAKFSNARDEETLYWNFEGPSTAVGANGMPVGNSRSNDQDPIKRLEKAYTGEGAHSGDLVVTLPGTSSAVSTYELRYFVQVDPSQVGEAQARASVKSGADYKDAKIRRQPFEIQAFVVVAIAPARGRSAAAS